MFHYCPSVGGLVFVLHVHFWAHSLWVATGLLGAQSSTDVSLHAGLEPSRRCPAAPAGQTNFKTSLNLKKAPLDSLSKEKNVFSAFGPFWPMGPLKTKSIFKHNKTKHRAPARGGSHLRNNATVKLDGVPNGSDAPRSSLRCYAGESWDWRHPVPCLSVHLSVRSHTRTEHICFQKRIAQPCWKNSSICGSPIALVRRNRRNCDLWGMRALFPVSSNGWTGVAAAFIHRWRFAADGGPPYHSFSVAWDKVLLCLWFCRSALLQGCEKRHRRSCYGTKVAGWKCFIGRPRCWWPLKTLQQKFSSLSSVDCSFPRLRGKANHTTNAESQQARHMVAKRHTLSR